MFLLVLMAASTALVPIPTSPPPLGVKIWELWLKRSEQDLLLQNAGEEEDAAAGLQAGWLRALHRGSTSCLFLMAPGTPGSRANCTSPSYDFFLPMISSIKHAFAVLALTVSRQSQLPGTC